MPITRAIVRGISHSFPQAIARRPASSPIDVERAREQHAAYVAALRAASVQVAELPPLEEFPDGCFVEDCAVVAEGISLIARSSVPSRAGEEKAIEKTLLRWLTAEPGVMQAPGTLDGGDCFRMGMTWFVGRSLRTNESGAKQLAARFGPHGFRVIEIPVGEALHLKCVCTPLDDRRLLLAKDSLAKDLFREFEILEVPAHEAYAANVLVVNGVALVAKGFPQTERIVAEAGFRVQPLEVSELQKADGSLTCLSILV